MASYGVKYEMDWTTPTADCRAWIKQEGYSSGSTQLTPGTEPFQITWAEQNREDLTLPMRVSTARLRFIGDSDGEMVQEIFDGGDTEWLVKFWRDTGSGYQLEWQGYLATDLWRDDPHLDSDTIGLEALDGLTLLENNDFSLSQQEDLYTVVREILQGLHSFNVAATMEWYPYREGNQLSGSALPLGDLEVAQNAFDGLEPVEGGGKDFRTEALRDERRVLEAVLERFGMELFQSRGEWRIRQRHRIQPDGTIKVWENQSAVTNDNPTTRDLSRALENILNEDRPPGVWYRGSGPSTASTRTGTWGSWSKKRRLKARLGARGRSKTAGATGSFDASSMTIQMSGETTPRATNGSSRRSPIRTARRRRSTLSNVSLR